MQITRITGGKIQIIVDQNEFAVIGSSVAYSTKYVIHPIGTAPNEEQAEWSASVRQVAQELIAFHNENRVDGS